MTHFGLSMIINHIFLDFKLPLTSSDFWLCFIHSPAAIRFITLYGSRNSKWLSLWPRESALMIKIIKTTVSLKGRAH